MIGGVCGTYDPLCNLLFSCALCVVAFCGCDVWLCELFQWMCLFTFSLNGHKAPLPFVQICLRLSLIHMQWVRVQYIAHSRTVLLFLVFCLHQHLVQNICYHVIEFSTTMIVMNRQKGSASGKKWKWTGCSCAIGFFMWLYNWLNMYTSGLTHRKKK